MNILTLNIWGAPYARQHTARLQAICDHILELQPDIICLQEVYLSNQRRMLRQQLEETWRYHHYFYSGLLGSGLMIFSRYPILETHFHQFRLRGKPEKIQHGDYYAAKGIGLARVDSPQGIIGIYNCHPHAQYRPEDDNEYAVFTNSSLYEAAIFIRSHSQAVPCILCGDLNTRPDQPGYQLICELAGLTDLFVSTQGIFPVTFSSKNPYVHSADQCLDYILARGVAAESITIEFDSQPDHAPAFSDHYGILANVTIIPAPVLPFPALGQTILADLHHSLTIAIAEIENAQFQHLTTALTLILSIPDVWRFTRFTKHRLPRLTHCLRWISILIMLAVAAVHIIHGGLNLMNRRNILYALESELRHHLSATKKP